VNPDAGATPGWPELVATVAGVHRDLPPGERDQAITLTKNYGEVEALKQARSRLPLRPVFSGYMGFSEWGPPPDGARRPSQSAWSGRRWTSCSPT
jgi:hypothetical protein